MDVKDFVSAISSLALMISSTIITGATDSLPAAWLRVREDEIITGRNQTRTMTFFDLTPTSCARACAKFNWCSSFVINDLQETCELYEGQHVLLNFSASLDTSYLYREIQGDWDNITGWCPVDDGFLLSPAAHFCFLVVNNVNANWSQSRDECVRRRLTLVVPDTILKMKVLLSAVSMAPGGSFQSYFIGASRPLKDLRDKWTESPATFDWVNGTRIDELFLRPFYSSNQPNNYGQDQNCLQIMRTLGYLLNDRPCYEKGSFICEKVAY